MILVDGDVVRYRCAFAAQKTRYIVNFTDALGATKSVNQLDSAKEADAFIASKQEECDKVCGTLTRFPVLEVEPVENALHSVKTLMASIQARYPEELMVVFLSCPTASNWRTEVYKQYKANRKPRRAEHDEAVQKYLLNHYHCEMANQMEADDLICIWAYEHKGSIVVTNDKDMDQIAGRHYDFTKTEEYTVLPHEAAWNLDLQICAGDSTDNIPGVPGMGLKKAAVALEDLDDPAIVYDHYYDTQEAADYWFKLNMAMVRLPTCVEDIAIWQEDIRDAREAFQAVQKDGEGDMPGPGRTGASESGNEASAESL